MTSAPARAPATDDLAIRVTLDSLLRTNAAARPDALALADPPDRASFTDGAPRRLRYGELEAAVDRLAGRFKSFALPQNSVVAIQLANTVEAVVALMAALRAGLVPAPVPVLWRRSDLVAALGMIDAKAIVTAARIENERPAEIACEAAIELFGLSFPCAFGAGVPDGMIPLDLAGETAAELPAAAALASERIAITTFDVAARGYFAVARSDAQWLAAGLATLLEARIEAGDAIVSTLPPASLAGIGSALVPWLLCGGTLELVHSYAPQAIAAAAGTGRCHLVAPAASLPELARPRKNPFASVIAVHRGLETRTRDLSTTAAEAIVDLTVFGEIGAVALRRESFDRAKPIPLGPVTAPMGNAGAPVVIETRCDADGMLALGGAMVPGRPFPANTKTDVPRLKCSPDGFVRTGFRCRSDARGGLAIEAGPDGIAMIGGLRFGLDELSARIAKAVDGAKVEVTDDAWLGARLRIEAENPATAAEALTAAGLTRLVIEAIVPRGVKRRATG